jgi:uncharacterized protein (DUF305 family)
VIDLADRIIAAQDPEITQLQAFLSEAGATDGAESHDGHFGGAEGNASGSEMQSLEALSGTAFDRRFVELMTAHHQGAISMAEAELAAGVHEPTRQLAQAVVDGQLAEIAEMTGWRL